MGRTIFLNIIAILIGWFPVVLYWPEFSVRYLLSASCAFGAIACVGSRFIYTEIIPKQLSQELVRLIQDKVRRENENI